MLSPYSKDRVGSTGESGSDLLFTVLALHLVAVTTAKLHSPAISFCQLPRVFRLSALRISSTLHRAGISSLQDIQQGTYVQTQNCVEGLAYVLGVRVPLKQGAKSQAKGQGSSEGQGRDELQREPDSAVTSHRHKKRPEGRARSLIALLAKAAFRLVSG